MLQSMKTGKIIELRSGKYQSSQTSHKLQGTESPRFKLSNINISEDIKFQITTNLRIQKNSLHILWYSYCRRTIFYFKSLSRITWNIWLSWKFEWWVEISNLCNGAGTKHRENYKLKKSIITCLRAINRVNELLTWCLIHPDQSIGDFCHPSWFELVLKL